MSEVFISYARGEARRAAAVAEALRAAGYEVWRDDELPPHRAYAEVIEERIDQAKAVLVLWSPQAVKSQWVRSEADRARSQGKLVQASLAPVKLPMPFDQIQCQDLAGWAGEPAAPAWRKLLASLAEMSGRVASSGPRVAGQAAPSERAPPPSRPPSIAVLPFVSSGGEEDRVTADGIADEIVTALSRFEQLKVIVSRAAHHGDPRGPAEVARALGAGYFLEGAVRRAGSRMRVSVSLTDATDLAQVWSERFEGDAADIFDLQDRVSVASGTQIARSIYAAETRRVLGKPTEELSAFELYLRAVHLERAFTREALEAGLAALDLAVARDPNFGAALAFASLLHSLLLLNGWTDDAAETMRQAKELARQAISAGADDAESVTSIATVFLWVGEDIEPSKAMLERALAANPSHAWPWFGIAWIELFSGRPQVALAHFERHLAVDPRSPLQVFVAGGIGIALMMMRRFDEGARRMQEALRAVPDQRPFRIARAAALAHLGRREEAAASLAGLPPSVIDNTLALFREDADRALIREGLQLAGADV